MKNYRVKYKKDNTTNSNYDIFAVLYLNGKPICGHYIKSGIISKRKIKLGLIESYEQNKNRIF